jgi:chromosome segregation ATPase
VVVNDLRGDVEVLKSQSENWSAGNVPPSARIAAMQERIDEAAASTDRLREHLRERSATQPQQAEHIAALLERTDAVGARLASLRERSASLVNTPPAVTQAADAILADTRLLKAQTPETLFRLRFVEIGLPLALSCVSILLTLRYPLTEARWREIKAALDKRRVNEAV